MKRTELSCSLSRRSLLEAGGAWLATTAVASAATARGAAVPPSSPLQAAKVSLIADAMSKIGIDPVKQTMSTQIRPQVAGAQTVIGPAVTTRWEAGRGRTTSEDVRKFVFQPLDDASAGSVWVVASGTQDILSMFGDIIALACKRKGMAGAVTDSGCRDIDGMAELEFPVFARAPVPFGPGDRIRPVAANVPVVCGGVTVRPGDLVAADINGIIVIPHESTRALAEPLSALMAKEAHVRRQIEAGEPLTSAYSL